MNYWHKQLCECCCSLLMHPNSLGHCMMTFENSLNNQLQGHIHTICRTFWPHMCIWRSFWAPIYNAIYAIWIVFVVGQLNKQLTLHYICSASIVIVMNARDAAHWVVLIDSLLYKSNSHDIRIHHEISNIVTSTSHHACTLSHWLSVSDVVHQIVWTIGWLIQTISIPTRHTSRRSSQDLVC